MEIPHLREFSGNRICQVTFRYTHHDTISINAQALKLFESLDAENF